MTTAGDLELRAGHYRLALNPQLGGSISRYDWRGEALLRPRCGPSIFDTASFPLAPFSNRIAQGRFIWRGEEVRIPPSFPDGDHPHALHGFGWLSQWRCTAMGERFAVLRHDHTAGAWPWSYSAQQRFELSEQGLVQALQITNLSKAPMPFGLGFHPYFPRTPRTLYRGLHRGEWVTAADGLPVRLNQASEARDWWDGRPVAQRQVDTVYAEREGPLVISWPERGVSLTLAPCPTLSFTVVYTPANADYFCVEPVSHSTDLFNRPADGEMPSLQPDETAQVELRMSASPLAGAETAHSDEGGE